MYNTNTDNFKIDWTTIEKCRTKPNFFMSKLLDKKEKNKQLRLQFY